ncbi:MAG TPA: ribokinase [Anaerolineales bacterium]|nr:ribokinase [Anaerolineales bacterium]HLB50001.1 ribokinase [Anaerolineales bacterium]
MKGDKPHIVIVGSFVTDLVFRAPRRPHRGETLIGLEFGLFTGGKGYNQAVAAARMGAKTSMVGRLGTDLFGDMFMRSLEKEGIDARHVVRDPEVGTGVASPVIYESENDNSIILMPRANMRLSPADVDAARDVIAQADVLLLQLEVPVETSLHAAEIARKNGATVVWNPAPARELPKEVFGMIDILTPNEVEAGQLTGIPTGDDAGARAAARKLREMGTGRVILTLGARGALMFGPEGETEVPAYKVKVVDPTAAGDAFCGGLAVALARGQSIADTVKYANAAGAYAVTVLGAEPSMPSAEQVERMLKGEAK